MNDVYVRGRSRKFDIEKEGKKGVRPKLKEKEMSGHECWCYCVRILNYTHGMSLMPRKERKAEEKKIINNIFFQNLKKTTETNLSRGKKFIYDDF